MIFENAHGYIRLFKPFLVLLILSIAFAAEVQEPLPFQISVNVDLVVLRVSVRTPSGMSALGLTAKNFEVFEDGVLQEIQTLRYEDIPVTVGLVVDHSGSMRNKLSEVATAAQAFVQQSSAADEMFVVNFNETVSLGLPSKIRMSSQANELARAIGQAPADGMTALYDAIQKSLEVVREGSREKKVLVVISDGGDTASKAKLNEISDAVRHSSSIIYTLGIFDDSDPDRNPQVLQHLAQLSGGAAYFPKNSGQIVEVCERIAKDIRQQYTLTYVSNNPRKPGSYRKVRVTAAGAKDDSNEAQGMQKLLVRTRAGYTSSGVPHREKVKELQ